MKSAKAKKKGKSKAQRELDRMVSGVDWKKMRENRTALIGLFADDPRTLAEIRREIW